MWSEFSEPAAWNSNVISLITAGSRAAHAITMWQSGCHGVRAVHFPTRGDPNQLMLEGVGCASPAQRRCAQGASFPSSTRLGIRVQECDRKVSVGSSRPHAQATNVGGPPSRLEFPGSSGDPFVCEPLRTDLDSRRLGSYGDASDCRTYRCSQPHRRSPQLESCRSAS